MKYLIAALGLIASAISANAADLGKYSLKDPIPAAAAPVERVTYQNAFWEGAYAGASINYETLNFDHDLRIGGYSLGEAVADGIVTERGGDGNGWSASIRAGYDFQRGRVVVGPYVEVTGIDGASAERTYATPFCASCAASVTWESNWSVEAGGRLGIDLGMFMLYAKLGYTATSFSGDASLTYDGEEIGSRSLDKTLNAIAYGGGVEAKLSQHVVVFGEVMHYDFSDVTYREDGAEYSADLDKTVGKLGLSYRF
jgi:outer membrane autotransporter protein